MNFPLDNSEIAHILGVKQSNVEMYWPMIETVLETLGIGSINCKVAALATVRVECPPFEPIHEYGSDKLHESEYGPQTHVGHELGNDHPGDGAKFAGRGFIQITGEHNYERYGKMLGTDMTVCPDKALVPQTAASILGIYFHEHDIGDLADKNKWIAIRRAVNGGTNNLTEFMVYVNDLLAAIGRKQNGSR